MSALWGVPLLVLKHDKGVKNSVSGLGGLDDVVNIPTFCRLQGVCKGFLVLGSLFLGVLTSKNDFDCALCSHDGDFCRWPSIVEISLKVLG